jgi:adenosylhomocysteine nucleosidase
MIVCSFALPEESNAFRHRMSHPGQLRTGSLPWVLGNFGRHEVLIVHTGIGLKSAEPIVREVLAGHEPWLWISSGMAGALDRDFMAGDIFLGSNISEDRMLEKAALVKLPEISIRIGQLNSVSEPAETVADKERLASEHSAGAVDMETEAIVACCSEKGIPVLSVRAISDGADQALPVPFNVWFNSDAQRPRTLALLRFLLRHPMEIAPFVDFVGNMFLARKNLARFLCSYLDAL